MAENGTHIFGLSPFSVAIISIVSAAAMLFTYHCIIVRWCSQREITIHRQQPQSTASLDNIPSSLENSITELIPSYKYSKDIGLVSKGEDITCAVCLSEFKDGEAVRVLPECLHAFHVPCIDTWLYSHSSCPLCRTDMTPPRHMVGRRLELDFLRQPDVSQP